MTDALQEEMDRLRGECIGCGRCVKVCPAFKHGGLNPMSVMKGGTELVDTCIGCANCSTVCKRTDPYVLIKDVIAKVRGVHVSEVFKDTGYAFPAKEQPLGDLDPQWDGEDAYVMPGCVVKCWLPFLQRPSRVALNSIGKSCSELPGNTCCMHPVQFRELSESERTACKNDMGDRADGKPIVALCWGCSVELNGAGVDAEHIIPFLRENIDRLPRFEKPYRVALEPGCEGMSHAGDMKAVAEALGCKVMDNAAGCCGKKKPASGPLMKEREAECEGADMIVVGCPMCFTNYDNYPGGIPVVHITELVSMAAGDRGSLAYHKIRVPGPTV